MKLYKTDVADTMLSSEGLGYWTTEGDAVDVGGVPMVRMSHGVIVPSEKWSSSRAEAIAAAARVIAAHGLRLIQQAERMRAELRQSQEGGAT